MDAYRKLTRTGGTKTMSVGKLLPIDWEIVKVLVVEAGTSEVVLRIIKVAP